MRADVVVVAVAVVTVVVVVVVVAVVVLHRTFKSSKQKNFRLAEVEVQLNIRCFWFNILELRLSWSSDLL